jgi:hypothetical protein
VFADLLILSNGPGEVATWVRPVVQCLREQFPDASTLRISLVLSPCPHATGQELAIARRFAGIDRFQGAEHFFCGVTLPKPGIGAIEAWSYFWGAISFLLCVVASVWGIASSPMWSGTLVGFLGLMGWPPCPPVS